MRHGVREPPRTPRPYTPRDPHRHFVESLRKQNDLYEEEIRIHEGQQALLSGGRRDLEERLEALGAEETALGREVERLSMEHERLLRDIAAWKEDGIQQQLAAIRAEKPRFNFAVRHLTLRTQRLFCPSVPLSLWPSDRFPRSLDRAPQMLRRRIQNLRSAIEFKEANIAHTLAKARDDRREIDRLRAVRVLQDDAMRRMEGELVDAEKALDAQRARAAEAREECDEARYSVVARFRDIVQEQAAFDRDLDFTRDQFLSESKRLRARKSGRAARTTEEQRAEQAGAFRHQGILSIEDEAALRADLEVLQHENEDRRAATAVLREQIHRRRMRLEGLRSMVGAEDDEAMKRVFEDMEERLSSLHRQGQTVAREMDKLQTSVRVLRTERDGLRAELIGVAGPRLADLVRARVEDTRQIRRQHRRRADVR